MKSRFLSVFGKLGLAVFGVWLVTVPLELVLRFRHPVTENPHVLDRGGLFYVREPARRYPWLQGTNVLRIAAIGDSFTYGVGGQEDDRYAARLERILNCNEGVRPVAVEAFAKSGTSTYQQMPLLDMALSWGAEIIILGICPNDAEDWGRADDLKELRSHMLPQPPSRNLQRLFRWSRLSKWIYVHASQPRMQRGYRDYYRHLWSPSYTGFAKFREGLAAMDARCEEKKVRKIALVFPLLSHDFRAGRYPFQFIHDSLHTALSENGWPYVDLLDSFRGLDPVRMQAVPRIDPHPSEIAHRLAAEALLNGLLARGDLDASFRPRQFYPPEFARAGWEAAIHRMEADADGVSP